eukprot:8451006-Ditylum_brightwellii.AAC.1
MEAKYIALYHSMRELLPVRWLIEELVSALDLKRDSLDSFHANLLLNKYYVSLFATFLTYTIL